MTPTLLRSAGEAMYGHHWQSFLARDLGVAERSMRRWAAGTHPIPDIKAELVELLKARRLVLSDIVRKMR